MTKKILISLSILIAITFTGCTPPKKFATIPNFKNKIQTKKNILIVPPLVNMYEVSSSGVEPIEEWANTAKENMQYSLKNEIKKEIFSNYSMLNIESLTKEEKETLVNSHKLMYRIAPSIQFHALETSFVKFDEKIKKFDYSLGDAIANISNENDLLLFINAFDRVQTSDKKAVETAKFIVGALLGVAAGDFGGETYSSISLVDGKTGEILWYNYYFSKGEIDLRKKEGTSAMIQALLNDIPKI